LGIPSLRSMMGFLRMSGFLWMTGFLRVLRTLGIFLREAQKKTGANQLLELLPSCQPHQP